MPKESKKKTGSRTIPGVTLDSAARNLHKQFSRQAIANHQHHAAGLLASETTLRSLGYKQAPSKVQQTSSAKPNIGKWIGRFIEHALIYAAIAE